MKKIIMMGMCAVTLITIAACGSTDGKVKSSTPAPPPSPYTVAGETKLDSNLRAIKVRDGNTYFIIVEDTRSSQPTIGISKY